MLWRGKFEVLLDIVKQHSVPVLFYLTAKMDKLSLNEMISNTANVINSPRSNSFHFVPFQTILNRTVRIIGKPVPGSKGFAIDFCTDDQHIAFHLNPRFNENAVVRNTCVKTWGSEERDLPEGFPFAINSPFLIDITVGGHAFEISLNGVHQFYYRHRMPIQQITKVKVGQGAAFQELRFF